ncbi:MAG: hypothetical protein U0229_20615 [Anaeromyxobacter sp.]
MRPAAALAVAALAAAAPAPAGAVVDPFVCPARGGPAWRELTSPHFRLLTDVDPERARRIARDLEDVRATLARFMFGSAPAPEGRVRVIAFAERAQFDAHSPAGAAGWFTWSAGERTVLVPAALAEDSRELLAHELTHDLLDRVFARQPRWFSEGVATFLQSAGRRDEPLFGARPAGMARWLTPFRGGLGPLLLARGRLDGAQYALSYALVHHLVTEQGPAFADLQARFARGEDPLRAWITVFPRWNPFDDAAGRDLDRAVGQHFLPGVKVMRAPRREGRYAVEERPLSSGEVHALRLAIPATSHEARLDLTRELRAEAEEALREDPGLVLALGVLADLDPARLPELAARAVKAHPEDALAWRLQARASTEPAAAEAAHRKAVALAPEDPVVLNGAAGFLARAGRHAEALPLAMKAARARPGWPAILDTLAAALDGLGRCPEALTVQRRAAEAAGEQLSDDLLERLGALEERCGEAVPRPELPVSAPGEKEAPDPAAPPPWRLRPAP